MPWRKQSEDEGCTNGFPARSSASTSCHQHLYRWASLAPIAAILSQSSRFLAGYTTEKIHTRDLQPDQTCPCRKPCPVDQASEITVLPVRQGAFPKWDDIVEERVFISSASTLKSCSTNRFCVKSNSIIIALLWMLNKFSDPTDRRVRLWFHGRTNGADLEAGVALMSADGLQG